MNALRAAVDRMGQSKNPLVRAGFRGVKALGVLRRFVLSARVRSQVLTRRQYKNLHFQGETFSCEDRYPELFEQCRVELAEMESPRILSFGCATGEEVFSLARYMPQAEIVGVDINPWCLKECARKNTSERIKFAHRMSWEFADAARFDAIFCMAVFQRTEHRTTGANPPDTGFTFERFDGEVALLDQKLKPGGLFFMDECDFSFEQTTVAGRYEPLKFAGNRAERKRPLFGPDNLLVASEHASMRGFVKRAE